MTWNLDNFAETTFRHARKTHLTKYEISLEKVTIYFIQRELEE